MLAKSERRRGGGMIDVVVRNLPGLKIESERDIVATDHHLEPHHSRARADKKRFSRDHLCGFPLFNA